MAQMNIRESYGIGHRVAPACVSADASNPFPFVIAGKNTQKHFSQTSRTCDADRITRSEQKTQQILSKRDMDPYA